MENKKTETTTGLFVSCPCGSKAGISETKWGYHAHCPRCGRLTFFKSEVLLEKVKLGAKSICDHDVMMKNCKGGQTSWCPRCRIRTFLPTPS